MSGGELYGLVFDVQRYAIHDGPGIRTTVYLKGCPLVCPWCHNPESQSPEPEILVDGERCIACGACVAACPRAEVRTGAESAPGGEQDAPTEAARTPATARRLPEPARCLRCGRCAEACVTGARRMVGRRVSVEVLLEEILRDRAFFETSGGGVTFSGGEPLLQAGFLVAALEGCRRQGLHTAVDTCGYASPESLDAVAALVDLWLYDLKTLDEARHLSATGVPLAPILENLRRLDAAGARIWVRIPLVPGFNDGGGDLDALGALVASLARTQRVHLLPFHRGAERKRERLGRDGACEQYSQPSPETLEEARQRLSAFGLDVIAGG
jgi:pyruvate formate lyase activating enzyme